MVKVAICDDEELIVEVIKKYIYNYKFSESISVDGFTTGDELYKNAIKIEYDIIFLDIELCPEGKGENGMQLSNAIKNAYPEAIIIFFTGNAGYERKLLDFEPFRFLNKPIRQADVTNAIEDAIKRMRGWEEKNYEFTKNRVTYRVSLKRIITFLSARPHIEIHCVEDVMQFRGKMDNVEAELEKISKDFLRPNKSCIVNRNYIRNYSTKEIVLTTGEMIPISRKYLKKFLELIQN